MRYALVCVLFFGCAHQVDRETACRVAQAERNNILRMTPAEVAYIARGSPAEPSATSARQQQLTAQVLGGIGIAALIAGFIEGFAGDPSSNEGVRISAWTLGGTAIALSGISLILGLTTRNALERARNELRSFADRCTP